MFRESPSGWFLAPSFFFPLPSLPIARHPPLPRLSRFLQPRLMPRRKYHVSQILNPGNRGAYRGWRKWCNRTGCRPRPLLHHLSRRRKHPRSIDVGFGFDSLVVISKFSNYGREPRLFTRLDLVYLCRKWEKFSRLLEIAYEYDNYHSRICMKFVAVRGRGRERDNVYWIMHHRW